jgi:hypothetical protein
MRENTFLHKIANFHEGEVTIFQIFHILVRKLGDCQN